jgi:hypothetical protein
MQQDRGALLQILSEVGLHVRGKVRLYSTARNIKR